MLCCSIFISWTTKLLYPLNIHSSETSGMVSLTVSWISIGFCASLFAELLLFFSFLDSFFWSPSSQILPLESLFDEDPLILGFFGLPSILAIWSFNLWISFFESFSSLLSSHFYWQNLRYDSIWSLKNKSRRSQLSFHIIIQ